jgi:GNAT superfamily N-acetyltransferase
MKIRFISQDEAQACNDFHNRIYGENRSVDQWRWIFIPRSFASDKIPFVVVDDGGKIAGTQAFIPIRLIDQDGVFWTAKSEETLLLPEYRGQGCFGKMYAVMKEYMREQNLHCVWGFSPATRAFLKIGFQVPAVTTQLFLPFSSKAVTRIIEGQSLDAKKGLANHLKDGVYRTGCSLARVYSAMRFVRGQKRDVRLFESSGFYLKTLEKPPDDAGELTRRFVQQWGGITIYRDADYLRWRVFDNPFVRSIFRAAYANNQLLGWVAFTISDDSMGYIVDLMVATDDRFKAEPVISLLLRDAVISLRNMGALGVRGWSVTHHPFDAMVSKVAGNLGFFHIKRGYSVVLLTNDDSDRKALLNQYDNWYVNRIFTEGVQG